VKIDHEVTLIRRQQLTDKVFEIVFSRPDGFIFVPGQKVSLTKNNLSREYTLINPSDSSELIFCVRYLPEGLFTPVLFGAKPGETFGVSDPTGFFTFQSHGRTAVFVATGTGVAPFVAFVRAGIQGALFLHGATYETDLLYRLEMEKAAIVYMPCLTGSARGCRAWPGRVTSYLERELQSGEYDFYLCGNGNMVRDAVEIIDRRFPGSRIFMETFF
jgi:benzoate/toluate 1,2-dioxygenase reductase subunit